MFVSDYRPTKRIGVEELDGCVSIFAQAVEDMNAESVPGIEFYEGAWLALSLIREGRYEYPGDFFAVFANKIEDMTS